ncbi:MAG: pirin family protein [Pseudobdellovibrio sp.]
MKKILFTQRSDSPHWVGDGFPVRTMFTYHENAKDISPFLLMDYAGPTEFKANPSPHRRGVEEHPHRGFETVTVVYEGEVEHRDSAGGGGVIKAGDVQWMTAGSGLVHEEKHGKDFSKDGGAFEMVQLWVNLPAKFKMTSPRYQGLTSEVIPSVDLLDQAGTLRVIAGEYRQAGGIYKGPAKTFTAINMWDLRLRAGKNIKLDLPEGHSTLIFVLQGKVKINDQVEVGSAELTVLDRSGTSVILEAHEDSKVLVLTGEPILEPVIGYGPFVMNTQMEIRQAFEDFQNGLMGTLDVIEGSDTCAMKS